MWYVIGVAVIAGSIFLALRLRVRVELSEERRMLFAGLGRSGIEINFIDDRRRLKLFGISVKTLAKKDASTEKEPKPLRPVPLSAKPKSPSRKRSFPVRASLNLLPRIIRAARLYIVELFRSVIIEEAQAEIRAGFESPHLTGQAYGYYFALLGAVPSLEKRLVFYPDWAGPSFSGSGRLSVALPMYALVFRTLVLLIRLPLVKLLRLIRGGQKGMAYAKQ